MSRNKKEYGEEPFLPPFKVAPMGPEGIGGRRSARMDTVRRRSRAARRRVREAMRQHGHMDRDSEPMDMIWESPYGWRIRAQRSLKQSRIIMRSAHGHKKK